MKPTALLIAIALFVAGYAIAGNSINGIPATDPLNVTISGTTAFLATSSTATAISGTTSITLTNSTSQIRVVPSASGTTWYKVGSGTATQSNAVGLTAGQITYDDAVRPGGTISVTSTGGGAYVIQLTH